MPKDSLKKLLNKYPYFLDKREISNFYKSQSVTNNQFKNVYTDLNKCYESFHINKRVLIWREQFEPYNYIMHFVVNYPEMKTIKIYQNETLIHEKTYSENINNNSFFFNYESTTIIEEDDVEAEIIPSDTFIVIVETFNEIIIKKGFPENDTQLNNEFDHDYSLDKFGLLNNIPRKTYITVESDYYPNTEPPFNTQLTEDDYHYMNRILTYTIKLHNTPLPVLELWKTYSIDAVLVNREKLLLKMFDIKQHDFNEETDGKNTQLIVNEWVAEKWEHKDKFCDNALDLGLYFFVIPNTTNLVINQDVAFSFMFLNSLGESIESDYTIDINLNNNLIEVDYDGKNYIANYDILDEANLNHFNFIAKNSLGEIIAEETIIIRVKGCNNGDWYVNEETGNDNNNGSKNTPFKTLEKAINSVNGLANLIVVEGNVNIIGDVLIKKSCTILGCSNGQITTQFPAFFQIQGAHELQLSLININLKYSTANFFCQHVIFTNQNNEEYNYETVKILKGYSKLTMTLDKDAYSSDEEITINTTLTDENNQEINNAVIKTYVDDELQEMW